MGCSSTNEWEWRWSWMVYGKIVNSLTCSQAIKFSDVLSYISRINVHGNNHSFNTLPSTYYELSNWYFGGRKSITKHLPLTKVDMIYHSYISTNVCILYFLLKKNYFTNKWWDRILWFFNLKNTIRIKTIVDKATGKKRMIIRNHFHYFSRCGQMNLIQIVLSRLIYEVYGQKQ